MFSARRDGAAPMAARRRWRLLLVGFCCAVAALLVQAEGHYLRASSRWLVRESDGERVKLACVNWAGHLETMVPEGLNRQPLFKLALKVKSMGFNCVRLTFATYMLTNATLSNLTVSESFMHANLPHSLKGIAIHNPDLVRLPVRTAYTRVVDLLTHEGLLVILDNHVSKPQWCCKNNDGNGFWGDTFFDASSWLQGLSLVASLFKNNGEMVGISLRNELRGPRQNILDWQKYMSLGAEAVHEANPNLIIILSGLRFATDLRFLPKSRIARLPFQNKLVYEMHWYTSSYGINFGKGNLNQACAISTSSIVKCGAYMADNSPTAGSFSAPLFISEFGVDQRGASVASSRFLNCFFAFMASMDLDWAYWPLQGNYYIRNGQEGDEEFYGILNSEWNEPRNISLLARIQAIQQAWQSSDGNSSSKAEYRVLFHPATGMCVQKGKRNEILLVSCMQESTYWQYTRQGRLEIAHGYLSIASDGEGQIAKLVPSGTEQNGPWILASVAKLQFSTTMKTTSHSFPKFEAMEPDLSLKRLDFRPSQISQCGDRLGNVTHNNGKNQLMHILDREHDSLAKVIASDSATNAVDENMGEARESLVKEEKAHQSPRLCLDGGAPPFITTKRCICVQEDEMDCAEGSDPSFQWFVLIPSTTNVKQLENYHELE